MVNGSGGSLLSLIVFGVRLLKPSIWGREWRESSWWQDVNSSCCDEDGDWFEFGVQKSTRGGNATEFWHDIWVGSMALSKKYHRLYNLSRLKHAFIIGCRVWNHGVWQWKFSWRSWPLIGRE